MRRIAWIAVIVAAVNLVLPIAATQATAPASRFHPMACPHGAFEPKLDVDCGYVEVPENRAHPNGRTIRVAAAVIHTKSANPRPDPIMFLNGGPSFGAISDFAPTFYFADATYAADRDVILVDTRGTGISRPRLGCPELDEAEVESFYAGEWINSEAATIYPDAIRQCRARLTGSGIDLAAYNSAESAADLEALRSALGIQRWNVLGISADGTTTLTYMRLFPGAIRSAVIDSGWSTQMLPVLDHDRGRAVLLEKVFAGCAANAACNAAYPGLRDAFFRLVRRLQEHPATITFPDFQPEPITLVLDGVGLYSDGIANIFPGDKFSPSEISGLLDDLWRVTHGELVEVYRENFGTGPVENSHTNDFFAQGKTLSYVCHDLTSFITSEDLRKAARDLPPFATRYRHPDFDFANGFTTIDAPAGCRAWDVGRANPAQHQPVTSQIPTMVLAGEYDSAVPPFIVRQVPVGLSRSYYYEMPASAHLQLASFNTSSDCSRSITTQFLTNPDQTPDASCVAELPPVDFTPQ